MFKSITMAIAAFLFAALGAGAATLSGTVREASTGGQGTVIAEAKVVLFGFGAGGAQEKLDSTTTNAQGRYSFDSVTTGTKQVVVTKAGFQTGQAFPIVSEADGTYSANITLTPTGVDPVTTGVVAGTVRAGSSTGDPVANALVVLSREAGGGNYIDSTRTSAQGVYRFDSVPAVNNYILRVTAAGYNAATNNNVDVDEGDTTLANFNLTAAPPPVRPGSIAGTVRKSADNAAVADAVVILSRNGTRIDSAETNSDGQYAFDSVAVNTNYTVTVTAAGFQSAVNSDVDVVANQTNTVDFRLLASGPATTRGSVIGTVTDASRKAVSKARVVLSRSGTSGGAGPVDTVETDASGDFAFDSVAALQNYIVTVTAPGFQTAVNTNVDVVAGQAAIADFILVASTGVLGPRTAAGFRLLGGGRGALRVEFLPSPWAGRISAYDARGALAYAGPVPAGAAGMDLPSRISLRFLVLERGGMIEKLQVAPLR